MGKRVLLVDDSKLITSNLKQFLADINDIHIDSVGTPEEAKRIVETGEVDIVILDIHLRERNGIDFLEWLTLFHPFTMVVMFSNHTDEMHRAAAHRAGAAHFFDKSFDIEEMHQLLEQLAA